MLDLSKVLTELGKILESVLKSGTNRLMRQPAEQESQEEENPGNNPEESQEEEIP